jgi:putative transposase
MKSRCTDQQIAFALQQAEAGTPVPEVCRKIGVYEPTFYRWKKKYGGLMPSEVKKPAPLGGGERPPQGTRGGPHPL